MRKAAVNKLGGMAAMSELNMMGVNFGSAIPITPAMVSGASGGSAVTTSSDNSQSISIQNLNLYGVTNAQEIFDELNVIANRQSIRNRASKELWD